MMIGGGGGDSGKTPVNFRSALIRAFWSVACCMGLASLLIGLAAMLTGDLWRHPIWEMGSIIIGSILFSAGLRKRNPTLFS
jgi:hypothetical protein